LADAANHTKLATWISTSLTRLTGQILTVDGGLELT
jgi:hypothetical protein